MVATLQSSILQSFIGLQMMWQNMGYQMSAAPHDCDFNNDAIVNMRDFGILARYYGRKTGFAPVHPCDLNRDGRIDMADVDIFKGYFLQIAPTQRTAKLELQSWQTPQGLPIYIYSVAPTTVAKWLSSWNTVRKHRSIDPINNADLYKEYGPDVVYVCVNYVVDTIGSFETNYGFRGLLPVSFPGHSIVGFYIGTAATDSQLLNPDNYVIFDPYNPLQGTTIKRYIPNPEIKVKIPIVFDYTPHSYSTNMWVEFEGGKIPTIQYFPRYIKRRDI